ncbi:MAG: hypothetical protein ACKN9T_05980, partial [Candidatus Methylumidiphilus sp.]
GHRLHDDRRAAAYLHRADLDADCVSAIHKLKTSIGCCGWVDGILSAWAGLNHGVARIWVGNARGTGLKRGNPL